MTFLSQFAAEAVTHESAGGIAALGINLQGFLFQLITFVLVLLLLRKFVYGKLVDTLETRRQAVIESLDNAKKAAKDLEATGEKTAELMKQAQAEAADVVALARTEAAKVVEEAEAKAKKRSEHLIEQAESRLQQDIAVARDELRQEMLHLVTAATEKVLAEKVDAKADKALIERALKESR